MKKILDVIAKTINIFLLIILIIVIIFGIFLLMQNIFFRNNDNFLFDLRPIIITSESMEPTLYAGDIIFIEETNDYIEGDIVTFQKNNQQLVTHRIAEEVEGNVYKTKGDNNEDVDFDSVYKSTIIGEVQWKTSLIRNVFYIITNKFVLAFLILFYIVYFICSNREKKKL